MKIIKCEAYAIQYRPIQQNACTAVHYVFEIIK